MSQKKSIGAWGLCRAVSVSVGVTSETGHTSGWNDFSLWNPDTEHDPLWQLRQNAASSERNGVHLHVILSLSFWPPLYLHFDKPSCSCPRLISLHRSMHIAPYFPTPVLKRSLGLIQIIKTQLMYVLMAPERQPHRQGSVIPASVVASAWGSYGLKGVGGGVFNNKTHHSIELSSAHTFIFNCVWSLLWHAEKCSSDKATLNVLAGRSRRDNLEIRLVFMKKKTGDDLFYVLMLCQLSIRDPNTLRKLTCEYRYCDKDCAAMRNVFSLTMTFLSHSQRGAA